MMSEKATSRNRRQDPVSCRLCRLKKLKCSRQHPCSNCVARNVDCEFEPNHATTTARIQQDVEPSNADILSRLQRLEDMILRMNHNGPHTPDSFAIRKETDLVVSALTPIEESQQLESQRLSSLGAHQPSNYPAMSATWIFEPVPVQEMMKRAGELSASSSTSYQQRIILVPDYADARDLFDNYVKFIRHYHHIIHIPTLRTKIFETFYQKLSRQEPVDTDHAALLLSIFSSVVYYLIKIDRKEALGPIVDEESSFLLLYRCALDLIDHSRRVLPGSLEVVQAAIILLFLDYNLEGFTLRSRSLLTQALTSAKELSLHRLDSSASTTRRETSMSIEAMIDLEMRRRVWWHLVSTDWMLSLAGSSQEGTYNIHPNQMRVLPPRNVDDEVLDRGNLTEDLPLTSPTSMSYPLQRVRLAQISRDAVDTLRVGLASASEIDYDAVMLLDKRVENFLEDLPMFLKLDDESIQKSVYVLERYPFFAMQRYIVNVGAQSIRCKMHQPFLIRSGAKNRYAKSTDICLSSAMNVIEINRQIRLDQTHHIPTKVKLSGLLHHMFLATVVLVVDLCFNKAEGTGDEKGTEVLKAIKFMEEAKDESITVQKFLDTLTEVLRKHHVRLKEDLPEATSIPSSTQRLPSQMVPDQSNQYPNTAWSNDASNSNYGYESIWRDALYQAPGMNMPMMPQMPDWDQLFSELDTFIA